MRRKAVVSLAIILVCSLVAQGGPVPPLAGMIIDTNDLRLYDGNGQPKWDFPSPDGKYVVRLERASEGGFINLRVLRTRDLWGKSNQKEPSLKSVVSVQEDVETFAWVPGRAHALVVATSDLYGWAGVRYWAGGSRWKTLDGRPEPATHKYTGKLRMYDLTRVRTDRIWYECWEADLAHLLYRKSLRLPK